MNTRLNISLPFKDSREVTGVLDVFFLEWWVLVDVWVFTALFPSRGRPTCHTDLHLVLIAEVRPSLPLPAFTRFPSPPIASAAGP